MIRASIGSEPLQLINCRVLVSSILRRTNSEVEFSYSWTPEQGWHPLIATYPKVKNGTKFSIWRWMVPELYGYEGGAIYLDADQIVFADIAELWNELPVNMGMAAVTNAIGVFGKKKPEPGAIQTSVMVMDCGWEQYRLAHQMITDVAEGRMEYRNLMQAKWLDPQLIHSLNPLWNLFSVDRRDKKLIHHSSVAHQPIRDPSNPTANIWGQELLASIEAGHLTREELESEYAKGNVHKQWIKWTRA